MNGRLGGWIGAAGAPLRLLLIALIRGYQRFVSPMLGPRCRYYPSCSHYGLQAVQSHGALKGVALSSWRLLRCNPFTKGGYDPVPEPGRWLPDVRPDGTPRSPSGTHRQAAPTSPKEA